MTPTGRPVAFVQLSRAVEAALDQLVLDELGAEPLPLVERLEDRRLMAGDASVVQSLPYTLEFDGPRGGITDKDGEATGFSWVQPNKAGNEYQPGLIDLDAATGRLKLTTTGTASAGGPWEGDNTLVNALQTQFNAASGAFTISTRLVGPLGFLKDPSEQGGLLFGPDQDNYIKLVAVAQPNGQFLQFVDEQKTGASYVHGINANNSYTSIGSFANVTTLDLMIAGDPSTGTFTGFFRVNGGSLQQLGQSLTLTGSQKAAFFNAAAKAGLIAMAKNNLAPVAVTFDRFEVTSGTPVVSRPTVNGSATSPADGATDVWRDAYVSAAVHLPNVGKGVDPNTLTSATVLLYRTSDHTLVSGHASTSGAGDTITFQPYGPLDANTSYTFEVTSGVKDVGGSAFLPYKETFTTGTRITETDQNIAFEKVALPTAKGQVYTGVTIGPDHRLYAGTLTGLIQRFDISADGTLSAPTNITTVQTANGANRTVTGITFDPASTANNLVLWINHGQYAASNATDFTGKLSRLSGPNLETYQDYVTNLPRSVRDHLNNQIAFGPDGALYFSQASNSSTGAPDSIWGNRPERLLNAAILRLDTTAVAQRIAAGQGALNVQTEGNPGGNYNPFAAGAPLTIYATGVRNAYDLVWTRAGYLYAPTNGSAAGGNTPSYPNSTFSGNRIDGTTWNTPVTGINNVTQTENDYLFKITQGGYYGHPNPTRGEYVLDGGNPNPGADYEEFTQYPVGTQPDPNYRGAAYVFGRSHSPDGVIEYQGGAFNGALDGKLLVTRYSGGADVMVLTPDAQGNIIKAESGIAGLSGFVNPVDLTEDKATGFVYVADYGAQTIVLARTISPGAHATADKGTYYFSDDYASNNTIPSGTQKIRVYNTGTAPLSIPASGLALSDTTNWVITNPPSLPASVPVGGYVDIGVAFKAVATGGAGVRTATLTISSNDQGTPNLVVNLRGLATLGKGGQLEPSLQRIFQLYQLPITTGDANPGNTNLFSPSEPLSATNDEVYLPRLVKAGTGPVTIEPLATFAGGSPAVRFGYYKAGTPGAKTELLTVASADAQTVSPTLLGTTVFDPGAKDFGLYVNFPIFKNTAYSEDGFNTTENTVANRRKIRFYALKNADGTVVPNAYVFTSEDYINDPTGAYDTNDFVGIIRNVAPAPAGGQVGLENQDAIPYPDRIVFNRIETQPPDKRLDYNPATGKNDLEVQPPNNVVHDTSVMRVRNSGDGPLTITSLSVTSGWQLVNPPAPGTQIPVGGYLDVTVQFVAHGRAPGQTGNQTIDTTGRLAPYGSAWSGSLVVNTDDADEPVTTVQLAGWWQYKSEQSMEPNLATQVNLLFGYKSQILSSGQQFGAGTLNGQVAGAGEEVLSRYWVRADANNPVSVRQLSAYHSQGNTAQLRWYTKNGIANNLFTQVGVDGQTLLPRADASGNPPAAGSFTPTTSTSNPAAAFQFRIDSEWGDDTMNKAVPTNAQDQGHHVRFFPARDRDGQLIANTWIMAMDYQGINYDYQDNVYLVTNMRPENPAAPTNPAAGALGPGINVTWTASASSSAGGYNVYRSTSASGPFTLANSTPVTGTNYLDVATAAGATYYYKVTTVDGWGGESAASAVVSGQRSADTDPPAVPTGLAAASTGGGIQLNWAANTDPDFAGYKVYRSDAAEGTYSVLNGGQFVTTASYLDTLAQAGQHGFYKVSAVDLSGNESALSDPADATLTDTTPPAVPTSLGATGRTDGIGLAWGASASPDLAGYRVYRSATAGGQFAAINGGQLVTGTAFTDVAVNPGETWFYAVTAVDASGNESAASNTASAARLATTATVIRINAGGGAYTDASGVTWAADNGFTGGTASTGAFAVGGTNDDPLFYNRRWGAMSYNLAAPDGTYTLRLYFADPIYTTAGKRNFSVKANGATILSNFDIAAQGGGQAALVKTFTVTLTGGKGLNLSFIKGTLDNPIVSALELVGGGSTGMPPGNDTTPPAAPAGVKAAAATTGINLTWTANGESDLAGYNVYRSTTAGGTYVKLNSALLTSPKFFDSTSTKGATAYYRIVAVDKTGNASVASLVSATRPKA